MASLAQLQEFFGQDVRPFGELHLKTLEEMSQAYDKEDFIKLHHLGYALVNFGINPKVVHNSNRSRIME